MPSTADAAAADASAAETAVLAAPAVLAEMERGDAEGGGVNGGDGGSLHTFIACELDSLDDPDEMITADDLTERPDDRSEQLAANQLAAPLLDEAPIGGPPPDAPPFAAPPPSPSASAEDGITGIR